MPPLVNLTGHHCGEWVVIGPYRILKPKKIARTEWLCRCSCGTEKWVATGRLNSNNPGSCGHVCPNYFRLLHDKNGPYVEVLLTNEKWTLVDWDLWVNKLIMYRWFSDPSTDLHYYVKTTINGFNGKKGKHNIQMHRMILGAEGKVTDHKDRNTLNNRSNNLRVATHVENRINCGSRSDNTSGFLGVSFCNLKKKFYAQMTYNKKKVLCRMFDNAEDAAKCYAEYVKRYHGEFKPLDTVNKV